MELRKELLLSSSVDLLEGLLRFFSGCFGRMLLMALVLDYFGRDNFLIGLNSDAKEPCIMLPWSQLWCMCPCEWTQLFWVTNDWNKNVQNNIRSAFFFFFWVCYAMEIVEVLRLQFSCNSAWLSLLKAKAHFPCFLYPHADSVYWPFHLSMERWKIQASLYFQIHEDLR